jgi:aconitate hydratase
VPLVIFAGREYGTGSSRDWAAKGTALLGIRAVIAESFERIHRSNLVGMGVLPLELTDVHVDGLALDGSETVDILGLQGGLSPGAELRVRIHGGGSGDRDLVCRARLDSTVDVDYFRNGGVLPWVLRRTMDD